MEVVTASPSGGCMSPFHNNDVREWSRLDSLTGVLERARLETDHWTASTATSSHKYGKVVDSRARTDAHGAVQQQAKRQLEVFQSSVPGGHLQVIKTHTVSSSRWTSTSGTGNRNDDKATSIADYDEFERDFEDLKLPLNPLDVTSQKSKASVGRSVGRRPPSRPRVREEAFTSYNSPRTSSPNSPHTAAATNLHRVSRLCHQIHEQAVKQTFGERRHFQKPSPTTGKSCKSQHVNDSFDKPPIYERGSGDGIEIIEIHSPNASDSEKTHPKLTRTKSSSSEDLHLLSSDREKSSKSIEDLEDLEQLQNWRRTSKLRRSLQFPKQSKIVSTSKPPDLPENTGSVRRIREDLETGRRLNTALRGNNVDLEALDQILQSISSASIDSEKSEANEISEESQSDKKEKRHSFVTVESLQEVKGRLRRTSAHGNDIYKDSDKQNCDMLKKDEETDDGIGAEEHGKRIISNGSTRGGNARVRSYVYGLETMMNKKPILGTGSLESRTSKQTSGNFANRNDDWYNRRKSYGFEKVHTGQEEKPALLKNKGLIESSTDSGICKSNDAMNTSTLVKNNSFKINGSSPDRQSDNSEQYKFKVNGYCDYPLTNTGTVKRFSSIFENNQDYLNNKTNEEYSNIWTRISSQKYNNGELEGTTITIPITSEDFKKQPNTNTSSISFPTDIKRHSIAVDETKYANTFRINDPAEEVADEDNLSFNRKQKKVEFCKTEVHFAPDSGKINIIETDEKPPPTNNFRRRRRNSGCTYAEMVEECNKKGIPMLHFGDNFENDLPNHRLQLENTVTVTTNGNVREYFENDEKENAENEAPKGILKNKPVKPKPYILGDIDNSLQNSMQSNEIWGVKLKPVKKEETPMWKSTVTLRNTTFDRQTESCSESDKDKCEAINNNFCRSPLLNRYREPTDLNNTDSLDVIRIVSPELDKVKNKPVTDRIKQVEENQKIETKGFSTRVNIGSNDLTFVQNSVVYDNSRNDNHTAWTGKEETNENLKKQLLNRGLVVRIGHDNRTTSQKKLLNSDCDNIHNKTTTKITIDVSPFPMTEKLNIPSKLLHSNVQEFKSPSLILNVFKTDSYAKQNNLHQIKENKPSIPEQLEALKRLYEDALSDSEADKEVQLLMNKDKFESSREIDNDCSSIVSGSWSKIRAYKIMNQEKYKSSLLYNSENAHIEKGFKSQNGNSSAEKVSSNNPANQKLSIVKCNSDDQGRFKNNLGSNTQQLSRSPVSPNKNSFISQTSQLSDDDTNDHYYETISKYSKDCSSSQVEENSLYKKDRSPNQKHKDDDRLSNNIRDKLSPSPSSPVCISSSVKTPPIACVVRNLRKSDMKYFGLKESTPPPISDKFFKRKSNDNRHISNKLQSVTNINSKKDTVVSHKSINVQNRKESLPPNKTKHEVSSPIRYRKERTTTSAKLPQKYKQDGCNQKLEKAKLQRNRNASPVHKNVERTDSPIYENIDEVIERSNQKYSEKEFDSSILDELTKAADQILQAVSDYADEETFSKLLSDEDTDVQNKSGKLETISESKSWKQENKGRISQKRTEVRNVKRTSSTSSIESTPERRKPLNTNKKVLEPEKQRKKSNDSASIRAATKARRLQRASSREALLHSHGSSSEDLPIKTETPVRKPRIIKKTKSAQLTITNGLDIQKRQSTPVKRYSNRSSIEEKAPVAALPEIRHKTAVSTIRSTAEKMASREKANKMRTEEKKKSSSLLKSNQESSRNAQDASKQRNVVVKNRRR